MAKQTTDISKSKSELKRQEILLTDSAGDIHNLRLKPSKRQLTLLDIAVQNSVEIAHSCGGMGSCGTCRVRLVIHNGPAMERGELESEMALERGYSPDERLSCQLEIPSEDFSWSAECLGSSDEDW